VEAARISPLIKGVVDASWPSLMAKGRQPVKLVSLGGKGQAASILDPP